jgi:hypothetical protein
MHSSLGGAVGPGACPTGDGTRHTRVLDISRELGWATGEASGLGLRGFAQWSMARLDSAHDDFTAGLRIFRETGNRYFEGFGMVGLGMACRDLGRLHEAADHLERAVALEAEVSWWDASSALQILGGVYWELGRLTDGLDLLGPEVASASGPVTATATR